MYLNGLDFGLWSPLPQVTTRKGKFILGRPKDLMGEGAIWGLRGHATA
jgi:hypothetical protein